MFIALGVCVFLLTVLIIYQLILLITRKERFLKKRFTAALDNSQAWKLEGLQGKIPRFRSFRSLINTLSIPGFVISERFRKKLQSNLVQSGLPLKVEEFILLNLLSIFVLALLGLILFRDMLAIFLFALIGSFIPYIWVNLIKARRLKSIEQHLLNSVMLIANSLRAGHSFLQAIEIVCNDTPPPLSDEFKKVLRETKLGVPVEEALTNLTKRVESKDLEMMVTGVLIQRQVGGNLSEILDTIAHTIDKRIKTKAKIKTLIAQPKLSGWIISILPFGLALFIFISKPEFILILITEPVGRIMLGTGLCMMVIGVFLIRKVVDIDV